MSAGLTWLIRPLTLMTLIKNLGHHKQPINQGTTGQLVFPQVDSTQLLQTLLNQLAISSQLSMQQIAPSAN
jgi:hypothetical protein